MKICDTVHQLRIDFNVTPQIRRYVYIYIIEGKKGYYLIDAGVKGSEKKIGEYIHKIGKSRQTINALLLTHSHPDHIGAARALKRKDGTTIYACEKERGWIEDIDLQYKERPIPNFYDLIEGSVTVDRTIQQGDLICLEPGIELEVIQSAGHSAASLSFYYRGEQILFTGDAIPVAGDIPIYVNSSESIRTLVRLKDQEHVRFYCPAWDYVYGRAEGICKIESAILQMEKLRDITKTSAMQLESGAVVFEAIFADLCRQMEMQQWAAHPLFKRSVLMDLNRMIEENGRSEKR